METLSPEILALAHRFDAPAVRALVLVGSHASGDAGVFSDVDLLRFVGDDAQSLSRNGTFLTDNHLVNVSTIFPAEIEGWFTQPEIVVNVVAGLRTARALFDRDGTFARVQRCARAFKWDAAMQQRANIWSSRSMVGWSEEAHKGLEGLRRNDVGRLLNAQFGLSWGLSRVMQVQRGVLLASDNRFFNQVELAVGVTTEWARLRQIVFNVVPSSLNEQVRAGLRLYVATAMLLADVLQPADVPIIMATVERINAALGNAGA